MKKYLLSLLLISSVIFAHAADRLRFKVSKPLCVLTFLQAASGDRQMSSTLTGYIRDHVAKEDAAELDRLTSAFLALDLSTSYNFTQYPDARQKPRNIMNIVTMAAVQTDNVPEFANRMVGILPNEQWLQLKNMFLAGERLYDKIIGTEHGADLQQQLKELSVYSNRGDVIFGKLKKFYGSTWGDDVPFTIALYGVPGKRGNTTATPHSNSLVLAVNTEEKDHDMRVAIAFHEIGHVLYEEQPLALQQQIDSIFSQSTSPFARHAYSYFDEALATAAGNGWVYQELSGVMDKTEWYNDAYINGYGHELYPLVQQYIEAGRTIDKVFIAQAIALFEKKFPDATVAYMNLFNKMNLYTDVTAHDDCSKQMRTLYAHFRISSLSTSYPINEADAMKLVRESAGTQLFFVHTGNTGDWRAMQDVFPQIKDKNTAKSGIHTFFDGKQRPIIVIVARDEKMLDKAIAKLEKNGKMEQQQTFTSLD